jgi:uncharacterized membrane protein
MNMKRYRLYLMITVMTMGAVIGWAVAEKNAVIPVVAAVLGTTTLYLLKRKVAEVVEDELVYRISERASRLTLNAYMMTAAIAGAVLIALRDQYPRYEHTGFTLASSVCVMLVFYLLAYGYYGRHME